MKTDMVLNDFMAIYIMRWIDGYFCDARAWITSVDGRAVHQFDYYDWNPSEDLNQTKLCLNGWHSMSTCNLSSITRNGKKYSVILDDANFILGAAHNENMALAICEAIREAVEIE